MKLIMENWRKYLKEGSSTGEGGEFGGGGSSDSWGPHGESIMLDYNIAFLLDRNHPVKHKGRFFDDPITEIWWDFQPFEVPHRENAEKAFRKIPILSQIKLKQHLGTGDNGIAFLLEDNSVFKIFMDDEHKTDFQWYSTLRNSTRAGDIEIHSFGEIESNIKRGSLAWVNMELTTPLTALYSNEDIAHDIDDLRFKMFLFMKPESPVTKMWEEHYKYKILKDKWDSLQNSAEKAIFLLSRETDLSTQRVPFSRGTLNDKQALSFTMDLLEFIEYHGLEFTGDIHSGNFGIAENGRYKIYDISGEAPEEGNYTPI